MGQGQSLVTLHVMNCSNGSIFLKLADGSKQECKKALGMKVIRYLEGYEFEVWTKDKMLAKYTADTDLLIYANPQGIKVSSYPLDIAFKRPFWLIAHKVNNTKDIGTVLDSGANAVEIDVHWDPEKKTWIVAYDLNLEKGVKVRDWFEDAKYFCNRLMLVLVDINTSCSSAPFATLLEQIHKTKFKNTIVFSVPTEVKCLLSMEKKLTANQGLATDFLNIDEDLLKQLPANSNIWYGNGTASFLPKLDLFQNIQNAVFERDRGQKIKKVYCWTLASSYSVSTYLDTNLDAIIVEQDFLQTARRLIDEYPFVRMANNKDDPFEKSELTCKILKTLAS